MTIDEALDQLGAILERVPADRQQEAVNAAGAALLGFVDAPLLLDFERRHTDAVARDLE